MNRVVRKTQLQQRFFVAKCFCSFSSFVEVISGQSIILLHKRQCFQYTFDDVKRFSYHSSSSATSRVDSTLHVLREIVISLKNERPDLKKYWDRDFVHDNENEQDILLSSDRHRIGRNAYKFCDSYLKLPSLFAAKITANGEMCASERQIILNFILNETTCIDQSAVCDLVQKFNNTNQNVREDESMIGEQRRTLDSLFFHKMKRVCTPLYEDLFKHMLEMGAGLGLHSIISIRQDLLLYKKYLKRNTTSSSMDEKKKKRHRTRNNDNDKSIEEESTFIDDSTHTLQRLDLLNHYLRQVLTIQFAPGFLDMKRITYQHSSSATVEIISRYEAVHPLQSLQDVRARLGLSRRVYGLFHPQLVPDYIPAVVLYISLQNTIPSSMNAIHDQEKDAMHGADSMQVADGFQSANPSPNVAVFYSISNILNGLSGIGLGEYLIKQAVKKLRSEIPSLNTFSTLSPLPKFRQWLEFEAIAASRSTMFSSGERIAGVDTQDLRQLAKLLQCEPKDAIVTMVDSLESERNRVRKSGTKDIPTKRLLNGTSIFNSSLVERILCRLAAHYVTKEKHRRKPLDNVARFHISNGAEVYRVNYGADMSRKGWLSSFGIMVNYKYNLDQLQNNQDRFESDFTISVHENVQKLLDYDKK